MTDRATLQRTHFQTSRLAEFCSLKELVAQTGHPVQEWPLVVFKELLDNALDACEDQDVAPVVEVVVDDRGVSVADNGPGLPASLVKGVLDFNVRVSSREAYVAPDRGAQGNALKTVVSMPFALDGASGRVDVETRGTRYEIQMRIDELERKPVVECDEVSCPDSTGTRVAVHWPTKSRALLDAAKKRLFELADDYTLLNPHLTLRVVWFGVAAEIAAADPAWKKWRPRDPTSPHWYDAESFRRLLAANLLHDRAAGRSRLVREFVGEFRGLKSTRMQREVLEELGMSRTALEALVEGGALRAGPVEALLAAMKRRSKPVKSSHLGPVGGDLVRDAFELRGCQMQTFNYKLEKCDDHARPWLLEAAFAYQPTLKARRLVTAVNWSPAIRDPFRALGATGRGLASLLEELRAGPAEPVRVLVHLVCVRVEYTDRGKSAVVVPG